MSTWIDGIDGSGNESSTEAKKNQGRPEQSIENALENEQEDLRLATPHLIKQLRKSLSKYDAQVHALSAELVALETLKVYARCGSKGSAFRIETIATVQGHARSVKIDSVLCGVRGPHRVNLALRKELYRLINLLNKDTNYGHTYRINPVTGCIYQSYRSPVAPVTRVRNPRGEDEFITRWFTEVLTQLITAGLEIFFRDLPTLLNGINQFEDRHVQEWGERTKYRQRKPNERNIFMQVQEQICLSSLPFNVFLANSPQILWPQPYRRPNLIAHAENKKQKEEYEKHVNSVPVFRPETPDEPFAISNKIVVGTITELEDEFKQTSETATVMLVSLRFTYEQGALTKTPFTKKVISKRVPNNEEVKRRFQNERRILGQIAASPSIYISKYYFNSEPDRLFMGYCPEYSITAFADKFRNVLSLSKKLFILHSVAKGLKFLKTKNIAHGDMVGSNILVGRGVGIKLKGLGLASYKGRRLVELCRPALSKKDELMRRYSNPPKFLALDPYVATSYEQDVYQFGEFMYELIMDRPASQLLESTIQRYLEERHYGNVNLSTACPEQLKSSSPFNCMTLLTMVAYKCLSRQPERRPHLEWLILIFRTLIVYLDTIY